MMLGVAIVSVLAAAPLSATAADVAGAWTVNGRVETFSYTLDCQITQTGERLGGACTDVATSDAEHKPQGRHAITSGRVDGDKVSFTYQTHFLAIPFNVTYAGRLEGGRISGVITVPGRRGAFTAERRASPTQ